MTSYAEAVNHLIRGYPTDFVIAKAAEKIPNFLQGYLNPWDSSEQV